MCKLTGIEKFVIKDWESWEDCGTGFQFFNEDNNPLELVKEFVDFPVYLIYIDHEKAIVEFHGLDGNEIVPFNIVGISLEKAGD